MPKWNFQLNYVHNARLFNYFDLQQIEGNLWKALLILLKLGENEINVLIKYVKDFLNDLVENLSIKFLPELRFAFTVNIFDV